MSAGDLVTVKLAVDTMDGFVLSCARVVRVFGSNVWVKVHGLDVPHPYQIGDVLPIDIANVVDWDK